jgi:hypothetical protein
MSPFSHRPPALPKRTESGNHPAVKQFREKLASMGEHTAADVDDLDAKIKRYLESVKTPIPPKP